MAQLSSETVGLNLNPQVMQVPQLGQLGMQLDEYAQQKKAQKQAAVQKLVGDYDTSLVHPKYQQDLNNKIKNLYDLGYRAITSKDPELQAQFQQAKRDVSIYAGHAKLAGDAFRKQQLDVSTNRSNYNIDDASLKKAFEEARTSVTVDDINSLDIANDVLVLPTKVQTTGMGIYDLAAKEASTFKENFVSTKTGQITPISSSNKLSFDEFTKARFGSWYRIAKGEDKERLMRDYWLEEAARTGETWDERKEAAMRNEMAQDPQGYEQRAYQFGLERFKQEMVPYLTPERAPSTGGSDLGKNKFSNFAVVSYPGIKEFGNALSSGADEKVKNEIYKKLGGVTTEVIDGKKTVTFKKSQPVFHAPLGDNKIQVGNKLYSDVVYDKLGNAIAYVAYKIDPKLLEQLNTSNENTKQGIVNAIVSENKVPEVIMSSPSIDREFQNSFNAEDWSVYESRVYASIGQ